MSFFRQLQQLPSYFSSADTEDGSSEPLLSERSVTSESRWYSGLSSIIIGEILIILDAISYGLLIFPTNQEAFKDNAGDGISMFLISTIVSQLLFAVCSQFLSVNGSMMIEVIPFLHIICTRIASVSLPEEIMPTVLFVYAFSSILTGLVFFILGYFRLGELMEFFPRHILIGTIGGVGWFLIQTGLEVTTQLQFHWDLTFLKELVEPQHLLKWSLSLLATFILRLLLKKIDKPWFVSLYFCILPVLFYIIVFATNTPIKWLKENNWLFNMQVKSNPFGFYSYVRFESINWDAIPPLIPTIISMSFFGLLHVPINIPALAISTKTDVSLDNELKAHGYTNIIAGLLFTNQNYLVYSNSVLFERSGGNSRWLMGLLGIVTIFLWLFAMPIFQYLPTTVVGALIFHIGLDLMKESCIDTWRVVSPSEYTSIVLIILSMMWIGFTEGVLIGIICACVFFVGKSSKIKVIRNIYSGATARSTVRRLFQQEKYLALMGTQIQIIQIQGFLFFGTVRQIQDLLSQLLREWEEQPIRYIILDFKLALGIDYSAAEAFLKIHELTSRKRIFLILSGVDPEIQHCLKQVNCWQNSNDSNIVAMSDLNAALEWCENALLQQFYKSSNIEYKNMIPMQISHPSFSPLNTFSPRHGLHQQAFEFAYSPPLTNDVNLLRQSIYDMGGNDGIYQIMHPYFKKHSYPIQSVIWRPNDPSTYIYIIQRGVCVISDPYYEETLLPGILFGCLGLVASRPRNTTCTAIVESIVYQLSIEDYNYLSVNNPAVLFQFIQLMIASSDLQMTHIRRQSSIK